MVGKSDPMLPDLSDLPVIQYGSRFVHREIREIREAMVGKSDPMLPDLSDLPVIQYRFPI